MVLGTVAWSAESLRAGAAALPHHPGPQAVCPCRERDTRALDRAWLLGRVGEEELARKWGI